MYATPCFQSNSITASYLATLQNEASLFYSSTPASSITAVLQSVLGPRATVHCPQSTVHGIVRHLHHEPRSPSHPARQPARVGVISTQSNHLNRCNRRRTRHRRHNSLGSKVLSLESRV